MNRLQISLVFIVFALSFKVNYAQQRQLPCSPGYLLGGTRDFIHIPDTDRINLVPTMHNRTIEFWFKADATFARQVLYNEGADQNGISIYLEDSRIYMGAYMRTVDNSPKRYYSRSASAAIQPNVWNHIAFVLENESTNVYNFKWYLNGVLENNRPGFAIPSHSGDISIGNNESGILFPIMPNNWYSSTVVGSSSQTYTSQLSTIDITPYYFKGNIALFRIWNRVRTQSDISMNMSNYLTASVGTGLAAYLNSESIYYKASGASVANSVAVANGHTTLYHTWTGTVSSDWNTAANWLNSNVPDPDRARRVRIKTGGFSPEIPNGTTAIIGRLEMDTGTSFTVKSGGTMEVYYSITGSDISSIVENKGSFKFNSCINSAAILTQTIQKESPVYSAATFYSYWSSPIIESQSEPSVIFPNNPNTYFFNSSSSNADWVRNNGANFKKGIGYAVRSENAGSYSVTFSGSINEGEVTVPLYYNTNLQSTDPSNVWSIAGDNLVGNPYQSAIDWDLMVQDLDILPYIDGTIYYWNQTVSLFGDNSVSDYEQYNLTGGSTNTATGKIASGQGFFIKTNATAVGKSLKFKPIYQVSGNNNQFFKSETISDKKKGRSWLLLKHKEKYSSILIGFINGATKKYDDLYDGPFDTDNIKLGFYSFTEESKKLTIQGLPLLTEEEEVISLGYVVEEVGEYSIEIQEEHIEDGYHIYLKDLVTGTITDLKSTNYIFYSEGVEENNNRFKIYYTKENRTLSIENKVLNKEELLVYINDEKHLQIKKIKKEKITKVSVFNMIGNEVLSFNNLNKMDMSCLKHGVYIIRVSLNRGKKVSDKIILE